MGKASRTKRDVDRRARIAAQRQAERRAAQRKRIYLAGGSVLLVIIVVVAVVLVKLNSGPPSAAPAPTGAALTAVINKVEHVPTSVTDKVGDGGVAKSATFIPLSTTAEVAAAADEDFFGTADGTPLTSGGKPELLFIGGEYCPYCAAERWAMINALSRFGTLSGLTTTHSSSTDVYPNTPTFSFVKSSYTSKYLTFTPVEAYGPEDTIKLQTPTAAEQNLWAKYDPNGAIPFLDFGNKYIEAGNLLPLIPSMLDGKSYAQIADALNSPTGSSLGTAEDANANYITAAICSLTNDQPATACTPTIKALQSTFAS